METLRRAFQVLAKSFQTLAVFSLMLLVTEVGHAQSSPALPMLSSGMSSEDIAIRDKARRKMYPGGSDEEPLKVQASLPQLKSKFVVEEDAPPPTDDAD